MRPMSASELPEIALDIAPEVNRLNRLESQMRLVQAEMLTNPALADICAESLALKLDNFYTGCERIFQIIASELNGGLPSSYDWHRRLLNPMSKPQDYRPAVLREDTVHKRFFGFCYAIDGVIRNETLIERDIAAIFVNCLRSGAN